MPLKSASGHTIRTAIPFLYNALLMILCQQLRQHVFHQCLHFKCWDYVVNLLSDCPLSCHSHSLNRRQKEKEYYWGDLPNYKWATIKGGRKLVKLKENYLALDWKYKVEMESEIKNHYQESDQESRVLELIDYFLLQHPFHRRQNEGTQGWSNWQESLYKTGRM